MSNELQNIVAEMHRRADYGLEVGQGAVPANLVRMWADKLSTLPAAGGGVEPRGWLVQWDWGDRRVCSYFTHQPMSQPGKEDCVAVTPLYATPPSPPVAEAVDEAMVERAAKAISGQCHPSAPSWRNLDEGIQRGYRATARAALQAALVRQAGDQP